MGKKEYIQRMLALLGPDVDPMAVKKQLENGGNGMEGIGKMTYGDVLIFIAGFSESSEALQLLKGEGLEDKKIGAGRPNAPTVEGMTAPANSRMNRRMARPTEHEVFFPGKERK